jgi:hypothetical protein
MFPHRQPPIEGEIRAGFGTKLISRVLSYDLVGTAGSTSIAKISLHADLSDSSAWGERNTTALNC